MKTLIDILLEETRENEVYFNNYLKYLKIIKKEVNKILKDAKVFVFGSILKGKFSPASDIDVLIVSKNLDPSKKLLIKNIIYKKIGFFSPFELHLITDDEYINWYRHFIKENIKEI
ncbi:MAG TPA: DNA polymerase subunit beta [Candidatus Omnitrophica bacterium]|nr:DNA polymerase subunit beta [Candidatus Omnitrophota bacterium]